MSWIRNHKEWLDKACRLLFPVLLITLYCLVILYNQDRYHPLGNYGSESDFYFEYGPCARDLNDGKLSLSELLSHRGSFYIGILSLFNRFIGDYFRTACLLSVLSSGGALLFSFLIIRNLFGLSLAWLVLVALGSNEYWLQFSYEVGYDMFNLLVALSALYFLVHKRSRTWRLLLGGFLGGMSFLTRINMIIFIPFIVLNSIHSVPRWNFNWKKCLVAGASIFSVFLIRALSTLQTAGGIVGSTVLDGFWKDFYSSVPSKPAGHEAVSHFLNSHSSIWEIIVLNPSFFGIHWLRGLWQYLHQDIINLIGIPIIVLVLVGLFIHPIFSWSDNQRKVIVFGVLSVGILGLAHHEDRFSLPHLFIYYILAFYPLLIGLQRSSQRLKKMVCVAIFVIFLVIGYASFQKIIAEMKTVPLEILTTANYIEKTIPDKSIKITSKKPHIAYYTGLEWVSLIDATSPEELARWALQNEVMLLYWSAPEYRSCANLRFLNQIKQHGAWKPLIYSKSVILYALEKPVIEDFRSDK